MQLKAFLGSAYLKVLSVLVGLLRAAIAPTKIDVESSNCWIIARPFLMDHQPNKSVFLVHI